MKPPVVVFWFRRDLRLDDNVGLSQALRSGNRVLPVFVFDRNILSRLDNKSDMRVDFLCQTIRRLDQFLKESGSSLRVYAGTPLDVFQQITSEWNVQAVYWNRDYEPYATKRDQQVEAFLKGQGIASKACTDQVIFEPGEVLKTDGTPYTVFTPYSRAWKSKLHLATSVPEHLSREAFCPWSPTSGPEVGSHFREVPGPRQLGFEPSGLLVPPMNLEKALVEQYHHTRDFPALEGTSRCSVPLRFGTLSIRKAVGLALEWNETWLNELIWREFFMQILFHFPYVERYAFRKKYEAIIWRNNEEEFTLWCSGQTGYPLVDAGMRQLNQTGWMHNRVRMITASFLVKHLLIDWRWGEAYFARQLADFDLSANNGNWQWAAGTGCDAAPYFRIFNPLEQARKYDPKHEYINRWVPEWNTPEYVAPVVDHKLARIRALEAYKSHV